eukprot:gene15492-4655_t
MEADHTLTNIFSVLSKNKGQDAISDALTKGFRIPDTVAFVHGNPRSWYYYTDRPKPGEIRRRERSDVTTENVLSYFKYGVLQPFKQHERRE